MICIEPWAVFQDFKRLLRPAAEKGFISSPRSRTRPAIGHLYIDLTYIATYRLVLLALEPTDAPDFMARWLLFCLTLAYGRPRTPILLAPCGARQCAEEPHVNWTAVREAPGASGSLQNIRKR